MKAQRKKSNKGIEAAQKKMAEMKANGTWVQPKRVSPIEKAKANPKSLRLAIRAFCYDCMGREEYVNQIKECPALSCPLHSHRPYQT